MTPETYPSQPPSASTAAPGGGSTSTFEEEVGKVGTKLKQQGDKVMETALDTGSSIVRRQKDKLASSLIGYATAMKAASESLHAEDGNPLASPAESASRTLEKVGSYLRDKEPGDFICDLENIARRKPELFYGAAFVAGLATLRFLKASSRSFDSEDISSLSQRHHAPSSLPPNEHGPKAVPSPGPYINPNPATFP